MAVTRNVLTTTSSRRAPATAEAKPFDGCWINVGVLVNIEAEDGTETQQMVKLPLGIPVDSLKDRKIFAGTNAEYAEQSAYINSVMDMIRERADGLEAGESVPLNLAVEVYRKQDEAEAAPAPKADRQALADQLFGS